jgi:hypothetical protein
METEEEVTQVNSELTAVCAEMFPQISSDVGIDVPTKALSRSAIVATLGLGAEGVRGALVLIASPAFFRSTYPLATPSTIPSESDILDWAGELANQALGRLNNRFARLGCRFSLGIPTVVSGDDMQIDTCDDRRYASLRGRLGQEELVVVLHVERTNGGPLFRPAELSATQGEGEGVLF